MWFLSGKCSRERQVSTAVVDGGDVHLGLPESVGLMGDHLHLVVHRRSSDLWRWERVGVDRIVFRITEL
jgi:hypothetical protein